MKARLVTSTFLALVVALVAGCSQTIVQQHSISAAFDVKVTDPQVRRLTDVTENIEIVATGQFTPGTYVFRKTAVTFDPDTHFKLTLSLPIDDPSIIHTSDATGTLWTSQSFRVNGLPVPQTVNLSKGQVSAQVDLVRSLGAFLISFLQQGKGDTTDVHQVIQSLHIEQATLELRPDSYLTVGRQNLHIGPASTITLQNVSVEQDFSYEGSCHIHLNFRDGCRWASSKVTCNFDGGKGDLDLSAKKTKDRLTLTLKTAKKKHSEITLEHGSFTFGKDQQSKAIAKSCIIVPHELHWEFLKNAARPHLHMVASMDIDRINLDVQAAVQETIAFFPEVVPATLQIDEDDSGVTTQFATTEPAAAESGRIIIAKKATSLTIWLTDAVIGPTSLDKSGAFQLSLQHGVAHMKQLDWRGNKSKFTLVTSGSSEVSIPEGMLLERSGSTGLTQMTMPLNVAFGTATIKGPSGPTTLTDLNGQLLIKVGREVQIVGDLGFTLPDSSLLGGEAMDLKAHGLDLEVKSGSAMLELKKCTVVVPQGSVQDALNKKVPKTLTININKKFSEDEKWRYRHAVVQTATIRNLQLRHMKPKQPDGVTFTAVGDAELVGTVEQRERATDNSKPANWEVRPWKMFGRIEADGLVTYKFVTQPGPEENQIAYKLSMEVPMPSNLKLDWSRVARGALGFIERTVIVSHLRKLTIPINYQGHVAIFPENNALARNFKIRGLVAKHTADATELDFVAGARF